MLMAHYCQIEVVSFDYGMPSDFPFPAAIDDTVAVWNKAIRARALMAGTPGRTCPQPEIPTSAMSLSTTCWARYCGSLEADAGPYAGLHD
jgi:hypothetical protein